MPESEIDSGISYKKVLIFCARVTVMFGTEASSFTEAARTPANEPNWRKSIRFRLGPIPGTESIADLIAPLLRRWRW